MSFRTRRHAGVLAAGSLAVLWLACMVPSGRIGLTGAAGLFPVAAVLAAGRAAGYLCWAASALLGLFLLCGIVLLAALLFFSPVQGPVVLYKVALVVVAAIAGMAFDFLAFPYALPSSYLDKDWRKDPDATGDDGKPDFPVATGYFRPFCAALLRRAVIIAAFVLAVALGL